MLDAANGWQYLVEDKYKVSHGPTLREIVAADDELPEAVKKAKFTCTEERRITKRLVNRLSHIDRSIDSEELNSRMRRRRLSLCEHLGKNLVCVFIRLPGIHYTIEIDPKKQNVVYWEWQAS